MMRTRLRQEFLLSGKARTKRRHGVLLWGALAAVSFTAVPSLAQVPSTVEPSRVPRNLEEAPKPKAQPRIVLPKTQAELPPGEAEAATFIFRGLTIDGAQVIPEDELRKAWPHAPGETVSAADIFRFAAAVTDVYHKAGYALSFAVVPQQEIEEGTFTIHVVEGYVERIAVEGDVTPQARRRIMEHAERIRASRPLKAADLERYMLLINDLPGITVSGLLSPATSENGAVLTVRAEQKRFGGSFAYNNFLPKAYGRHVGEATVEARGLVTGSDLIRISGRHSLTSDAYRSIWADASTGIGANGFRIGATGFYSETKPKEDARLSALDYRGDSVYGQLYAQYPLIRSREQNLNIGGAFTINNTKTEILGADFSDDRLRTVSLWGYYDFVDATRAVTWAKVTVTRGIDGLGARGDSRAAGRTDYTTVEFDMQRDQPVAPVLGGNLWLRLGALGQATLSADGLFSAAECTYGGPRFGRAFDSGVISGDHCLTGVAEVHWKTPVELTSVSSTLDFFGFVDGGKTWENGALQPGEARSASAVSAGGGVNIQIGQHVATLDAGRRLHLSPGIAADDWKVAGSVTLRF